MNSTRFSTFCASWYAAILLLLLPATASGQGTCPLRQCTTPYSLCTSWCFEVYDTDIFWDVNCATCTCESGCCFHYENPSVNCEAVCGAENISECKSWGSCTP